jgi:hypothetical protein
MKQQTVILLISSYMITFLLGRLFGIIESKRKIMKLIKK